MMTPDPTQSASDKSRVAICCATDDHYALYCGVTLASIINHASPEYSYDVTILESALHERNKEKLLSLHQMAADKGIAFSIRFVNVLPFIEGKEFYTHKHYKAENYYRLYAATIFSHEDKILYLDVDIILQCDVAQLFHTDIGANWVGACKDAGVANSCMRNHDLEPYFRDTLGVNPYHEYFNSGVLLMNLRQWRDDGVEDRLFQAINEVPEPKMVDQCILNKVCHGHVHFIDRSWNRSPEYRNIKADLTPELLEELREDAQNPGIIHYHGPKPWHSQNAGGRGDEWWAEAKTTPFFGEIIHFALCEMAKTELKKQDAQQTKKINELREALRQARIAHDAENKKQASEQAKTQAELNKAKAELAKLQKEQRAHREASAAMLREVALLPLTWLNLQRCRVAQHLTFGKAHERYKRKKKRLRERVMKALHFLSGQ